MVLINFARDECYSKLTSTIELEGLLDRFPVGRLGFKAEGAGKQRILCIPNSLKLALLRPAHDRCMSVWRTIPMDGTYQQTKPLRWLTHLKLLFSYDLSQATDGFPL